MYLIEPAVAYKEAFNRGLLNILLEMKLIDPSFVKV